MKTERNPELEAVGRRVRAARLNRGMTKEALAEAAETSTQFLSQIEKGEQSMTILKFKRLATALGVSSDYLLYGREGMDEQVALAAEYLTGLNLVERDLAAKTVAHLRRLMDELSPEYE